MKNTLTGRKFAAPSIVALIVVMLSTTIVSAQPTSSPTGGNVDARFSTLGVGVLGSEAFLIGSDGSVSNPGSTNGGVVNFSDGITSTATGAASAVVGTATSGVGVSGFSTSNYGVSGWSTSGTGGVFQSSTNNGVFARSEGASGVYGLGTTYGVYGEGLNTGSSVGGFFRSSATGTQPTALLGTPSAAVDAQGDIVNSSATFNGGQVRVVDANGFGVTAPTAPVRFAVNSATGAVSNPVAGEPARITDSSGLNIDGSGGTNVDLVVDGRIQTGDGASRGGMWVSSDPAEPLFVGNNAYQGIGFYNNGWGLNLAPGGLVGIGTRTPASHLQISNNVGSGGFDDWSDFQLLLYEGASPASSYGLGIESGTLAFNANNNFRFYTDNIERMGIYDSEVHMNGDVDISGKTNLYDSLYLNGNDIWGFSGSNIYAAGYINSGSYVTANDIGDFEYDSSTYTLSPLQRFTNCLFGSSTAYGAYFTTISGGYRLTAGSPVKVEASYPADLLSYGEPTHWCVTYYNPSATTSYTTYTYAFDWSPNLSPGNY